MKNTLIAFLLAGLTLFSASALTAEHPQLKAFPAAKADMERFVIVLPHKERGTENAFKVEITAGKEMLTDGVNLVRLGSNITEHPLQGWGYTYYEVTGSAATMSTLMAPPPGAAPVKKFVAGTSLLIPYNSRLPVVVYAPKGYEIRYRIWQAAKKTGKAKKG